MDPSQRLPESLHAIGAGAEAISVFGDAWFGVFSGVMTLLILFLSEIIPKTLGALRWRTLLEKRQHIAVVVGEYGETKGLVTLEDVLETLLGIEILDKGDKVEDMQQLARQLWARRAEWMGIAVEQA